MLASRADFGILVCKSGIGMSIAANRYPHIRAALVDNRRRRRGPRASTTTPTSSAWPPTTSTPARAPKIVEAFLSTAFEGGRHERRVEKLDQLGTPNATHPSLAESRSGNLQGDRGGEDSGSLKTSS